MVRSNKTPREGMRVNTADTAWYLRVHRGDVAPGVVLVGDRGRALMAGDLLDDATVLNQDRGLTTVKGTRHGVPLMVTAFGMGAPIATVVLHELAALGATTFLRAGTMLAIGDSKLGDYIAADRALVHEGTTVSYGLPAVVAEADAQLTDRARQVVAERNGTVVSGTVASCDGFYSQMSDFLGRTHIHDELRAEWAAERVVGVDMETSALLSVGLHLGVRVASVCLASVDLATNDRMEPESRMAAEFVLMESALDTLAAFAAEANTST